MTIITFGIYGKALELVADKKKTNVDSTNQNSFGRNLEIMSKPAIAIVVVVVVVVVVESLF